MSFHQGLAKSSHRNQDHAKNWKNQIFKTFPIKFLTVKNAATKTKILPKAGKNNFSVLFSRKKITGKNNHQTQDPTKNSKLLRLDFNFRNLSLSLG